MRITKIAAENLRGMKNKEGLILQGCGGDLEEWVTGVNDLLTEEKILLGGSRIENCFTFRHDGLICLLFPLKDAKVDFGKLAMWRLKTYSEFGGTWLSDYVPNRLGGFVRTLPQSGDCVRDQAGDGEIGMGDR